MKSPRSVAALAIIALTVTAFGGVLGGGASSQETMDTSTRSAMRGVFVTLSKVYGYSVDPAAFEDPANREKIQSALKALVGNTAEVQEHTSGLDVSFEYLKSSLAFDANEALTRFDAGQYVGSRWMLSKITENCMTCHSKLPSGQAARFTEQFLQETNVKALDPLIRAELALATRQFDLALDEYEAILADPLTNPRSIWITGTLENYVRVACGVREDRERAVRTLSQFAAREDAPGSAQGILREWIRALGDFDLSRDEGRELAAARGLIREAQASVRFPKDRSRQVAFIQAAALLHRYLQTEPDSDADVAEALYLLGVAESFISRSYWISETDYLLEQAIRRAPSSAVAKEAYEFLEEYLLSDRANTARQIPADVEKRLEELRALIEASSG